MRRIGWIWIIVIAACTRAPSDGVSPAGAAPDPVAPIAAAASSAPPAPSSVVAPAAMQVPSTERAGPADSATPSASVTPAAQVEGAASTQPQAHLALSGEGLDVVLDSGSVRHLSFGTPATQAIDAVTRLQGPVADRGTNGECGAGPLDMASWPNGLTLISQDGRFVGWSTNARAGAAPGARLTTIAGVGLGSTRRELTSAYAAQIRQTTLGTEFAAGGLFGVLDGPGAQARIDALWAGTSCVFR